MTTMTHEQQVREIERLTADLKDERASRDKLQRYLGEATAEIVLLKRELRLHNVEKRMGASDLPLDASGAVKPAERVYTRFYVWTAADGDGAKTVFEADDRALCIAFVRALPTRAAQDAHVIQERVRQNNGQYR